MNIEKKKVAGKTPLSNAAKTGFASLLGMTSIFMTACLDESENNNAMGPAGPNSSDDSTPPEAWSSSSIDIPLSHERLSSEAIEALSSSSVQKPSSSSFIPGSSSGGHHAFSSSSIPSLKSESSSSSVKEEPSSYPDSIMHPRIDLERNCDTIDSMGVNVIMCHDYIEVPMVSMVSTYNMYDIT